MGIDQLAQQLYEQCCPVAPGWDQIGEVTKSVWREHAQRRAAGDPEWWSCLPRKPAWPIKRRRIQGPGQ